MRMRMRMTGTASKGNFCRAEKQSGAQPQWWEFSTYVLRFLFIHVIITTNTTTTTTLSPHHHHHHHNHHQHDDIDENAYYMWRKSWSMFKWTRTNLKNFSNQKLRWLHSCEASCMTKESRRIIKFTAPLLLLFFIALFCRLNVLPFAALEVTPWWVFPSAAHHQRKLARF